MRIFIRRNSEKNPFFEILYNGFKKMSRFGCLVVWLARQALEKVTEKALVILCNIGNEMHLRSTDLGCTLAF